MRRAIIDFYLGLVAESPNDLVASGDDFLAILESGRHFDIGGSGDAGFELPEFRLSVDNHEDTLDFFLFGLVFRRVGSGNPFFVIDCLVLNNGTQIRPILTDFFNQRKEAGSMC